MTSNLSTFLAHCDILYCKDNGPKPHTCRNENTAKYIAKIDSL